MIELPALFLANLAGALPFHYRRKQYNSSKKHDPSLHRKEEKKQQLILPCLRVRTRFVGQPLLVLALLYHSIEPLVFVTVVGPIVQVIVVCKGMIAIQAQLMPDFF
jgi:hypothetical protein